MKSFIIRSVFLLAILVPASALAWGSAYPGCGRADIVVGNQIWAACNSVSRSEGSDAFSGWFGWGQTVPLLVSQNGRTSLYEGVTRPPKSGFDWSRGPCASGYRIPTRYEWEDVILSARRNGTSVSALLSLPRNGARMVNRDKKGRILSLRALGYEAAYWTSTSENLPGWTPMILHIGQSHGYSRYDSTDGTISDTGYEWRWTEDGKELIERSSDEVANVRCIRDL